MLKTKNNQMIFFIIIPLFLLFISFIFDYGIIFFQETRLELATKSIMKDAFKYNVNDYYETVKEGYEKKKLDTTYLKVEYNEEKNILFVHNSISSPSLFGKLFGIKDYRSDINLTGYEKNDKIIFEEAVYE